MKFKYYKDILPHCVYCGESVSMSTFSAKDLTTYPAPNKYITYNCNHKNYIINYNTYVSFEKMEYELFNISFIWGNEFTTLDISYRIDMAVSPMLFVDNKRVAINIPESLFLKSPKELINRIEKLLPFL